ncbi:hypothetical protein B0H19DRAFT_1266645 [Mycena capillaripes]|nr:hypothetical protein B0H19DRAFT_1266645 [Mycena capillaripes]
MSESHMHPTDARSALALESGDLSLVIVRSGTDEPNIPIEDMKSILVSLANTTGRLAKAVVCGGIMNMCEHAMFIMVSSGQYVSTLPFSPLIPGVGALVLRFFSSLSVFVVALIRWAFHRIEPGFVKTLTEDLDIILEIGPGLDG